MAYTAIWSSAIPLGSLAASDIDQAIRDTRRDIGERFMTLFGLTAVELDDDPMLPLFFTVGAGIPAASGLIRAPNNQNIIVGRNAGNTADIVVAKVNAADMVELGGHLIIDPATGKQTWNFGSGILTQVTLEDDPLFPDIGGVIIRVPTAGYIEFRRRAALGGLGMVWDDRGVLTMNNAQINLAQAQLLFPSLNWPDAGAVPAGAGLFDGGMWFVGNDLFKRIGGVTKKVTFA